MDYASHSPQVEQLQDRILAALDGITPAPAQIPMISAMTGQWLDGPEAGPRYWYDSLRAPVEFGRAIQALAGSGHDVFAEVSPHPVLTTAITGPSEPGRSRRCVTGTLRRDDGGPARFLAALAALHVRGTPVNWAAVLGGGQQVDLPTYAFRHQRYWPQPSRTRGTEADGSVGSAAEAGFWAAVEGGDVQRLAAALDIDERARFDQVLPVLASWRRRERDRSLTGGWRYRVAWMPVPDPGAVVLSGTWLLVIPPGLNAGPDEDLGGWCEQALAARGARVTRLMARPARSWRPGSSRPRPGPAAWPGCCRCSPWTRARCRATPACPRAWPGR